MNFRLLILASMEFLSIVYCAAQAEDIKNGCCQNMQTWLILYQLSTSTSESEWLLDVQADSARSKEGKLHYATILVQWRSESSRLCKACRSCLSSPSQWPVWHNRIFRKDSITNPNCNMLRYLGEELSIAEVWETITVEKGKSWLTNLDNIHALHDTSKYSVLII